MGIILLELCVPFATEMERIVTLQNAKKQVLPPRFIRELPVEVSIAKITLGIQN